MTLSFRPCLRALIYLGLQVQAFSLSVPLYHVITRHFPSRCSLIRCFPSILTQPLPLLKSHKSLLYHYQKPLNKTSIGRKHNKKNSKRRKMIEWRNSCMYRLNGRIRLVLLLFGAFRLVFVVRVHVVGIETPTTDSGDKKLAFFLGEDGLQIQNA